MIDALERAARVQVRIVHDLGRSRTGAQGTRWRMSKLEKLPPW